MITTNDKRVLEAIGQFLAEAVQPITYTMIQERSAVSNRTVVRAINRLTRAGYLVADRDMPGLPYTYKILKQPETNGA